MPDSKQKDTLLREKAAKHLRALFQEATVPDETGEFFKALHNINHAYRQELSEHLGLALKAYLGTQQPTSYEEMKALALQVNTLLRDFGLAFSFENKPCLLRAQLDGESPRFRLEAQDSRKSRPFSFSNLTAFLPLLVLTEEAPRRVCHQETIRRL